MSYNGSGTFVINTAGQPVVSGTVISSTAFNALTADLATGLSTAITKDGQTTPTANIPMGNNKITGLAVGTAATDAANLSQVQSTVAKLVGSVSGVDTITGTMSPTLAAYATGQMFYFIAAGDNTGAVTLNLDGLGAKAVTRDGSVALAAGDIKSGEVVVVVYDGTRFQVVSQLNSAGNATFANVSITSALNVGGVATFSAGTAAAPSITTSGDTNNGIFFPATDVTAITTAGTERLRVSASGVLGLGVTPSSWLANSKAFQFGATGSLFNFSAITRLGENVFYNSSGLPTYIADGYSELYVQDGGEHNWFSAASGIAGNVITFDNLMTLTSSGNLGIGTSSPQYKLQVSADDTGNTFPTAAAVNVTNTNTSGFGKTMGVNFSVGTGAAAEIISGVYGVYTNYTSSVGGALAFVTNNGSGSLAEKMRLDTSGNLGIGTSSPTTAGAGYTALGVNGSNGSNLALNGGGTNIGLIYAATGNSNLYVTNQTASGNLIFGAGSGNERARIDASGNLGLGVTPSAWSGNAKALQVANAGVEGRTNAASYATLSANGYTDAGTWKYISSDFASRYTQFQSQHLWYTAASGTAGNAITFTQALTLDASGHLYPDSANQTLGTSAKRWGTVFATALSDAGDQLVGSSGTTARFGYGSGWTTLAFATGGSERARITSGGVYLVGTTNTAGSAGVGVKLHPDGLVATVSTTSISDSYNYYSETAGAYRFYVTNGGTVFATNTTISAISDQRLKENIRDLDAGLDAVMALKPRKFDWKEGKGQDKKDVRGFIAQEFEQVFPDLIDTWKDPAPEGEEPYKSVRQDLIPVLVKAIQELKAELDAAKVKIAALEAK